MAKAGMNTATKIARILSGAAGEYRVRSEEPLLAAIRSPHEHWREDEFAQIAIQAVYDGDSPKHIKKRIVIDKVNDWLARYPAWQASGYSKKNKISGRMGISDRTVLRALRKVFP
jgi:hypothetical protein